MRSSSAPSAVEARPGNCARNRAANSARSSLRAGISLRGLGPNILGVPVCPRPKPERSGRFPQSPGPRRFHCDRSLPARVALAQARCARAARGAIRCGAGPRARASASASAGRARGARRRWRPGRRSRAPSRASSRGSGRRGELLEVGEDLGHALGGVHEAQLADAGVSIRQPPASVRRSARAVVVWRPLASSSRMPPSRPPRRSARSGSWSCPRPRSPRAPASGPGPHQGRGGDLLGVPGVEGHGLDQGDRARASRR
jgi:hypothetical protein